MKKRHLVFAGALIVLLIFIYLAIKMCKVFPDVSVYYSQESMNCCTDDGLYYVKNINYIYHLDQQTKEKAPICRKTNCLHNDNFCNAFIEADLPPGIMKYNDRLYIISHYSEIVFNDETFDYTVGKEYCRVYEAQKDGKNRSVIFESESGIVQSVLASGDTMYIAYTKHRNEKSSGGEVRTDAFLCSYNLRWRTINDLYCLTESEEIGNPIVNLISNSGNRILFSVSYEGLDGVYVYKLNEIYDGRIIELSPCVKKKSAISSSFMSCDQLYMIENKDEDWKCLVAFDDSLQTEKGMIAFNGCNTTRFGNEYILIAKSDYEKCLYNYRTNDLYVANTCFKDDGKYISDIIGIDRANDVVYIDQHDYTGMKPGEIYYYDLIDYGCCSYSVFINKYFMKYEELSDDEKKELGWILKY